MNEVRVEVQTVQRSFSEISETPVLPLTKLFQFGETMEKIYDKYRVSDRYDDEGNEKDGVDRLFPDEIDWEEDTYATGYSLMSEILDTEFMVQDNPNFPNEVNKSLNAAFIAGLDANRDRLDKSTNVLVLCAGDGEDMSRLLHSGVGSVQNVDFVGASEFNNRASMGAQMFRGKVRTHRSFLHNVEPEWFEGREYDLILCHHGLHHILSTHMGEQAFLRLLSNNLKPSGKVLADKIDLNGLDTMDHQSSMPAHGVELLRYDMDEGIEGMMYVRVKDKVWKDPVLSDPRLYRLLKDYNVHILQGRSVFQGTTLEGRPITAPASVSSAAKRSETRVITYVEIAHYPPYGPPLAMTPRISPVPAPVKNGPVGFEERFYVPGYVVQLFKFPIVRGKHFQPGDVTYLSDGSTMYAEKTDGSLGRMVVTEGGVWVQEATATNPRMFFANGRSRQGYPILRLEVEIIYSGRFLDKVVLLDPISLGPQTPSGFAHRLNYFSSILLKEPWLRGMLEIKQWTTSWDSIYSSAIRGGWEGIVVMQPSAPCPFLAGGRYLDLARYIKFRPTIDVLRDGGIVEVCARTEEIIRPRPDKANPNSKENIDEVKRSLLPEEVNVILSARYDLGREKEYIEGIIEGGLELPLAPCPELFQMLRFPNRWHKDPRIDAVRREILDQVSMRAPAHMYTPPDADRRAPIPWEEISTPDFNCI